MTEHIDTPHEPAKPSRVFGVVTYLDILGWKGIYQREEDPIQLIKKLIEVINGTVRGTNIEIIAMSDTIALFSKVSEAETLIGDKATRTAIDVHGAACKAAVSASIADIIPVRGATSCGTYAIEDNIFVGRAIDEVAAWYEQSNWIGVHLTPSARLWVGDVKTLSNWCLYDVPIKIGPTIHTDAVDWWSDWSSIETQSDHIYWLQSHFLRMSPILPEFADKIKNTLMFAEKREEERRNGP